MNYNIKNNKNSTIRYIMLFIIIVLICIVITMKFISSIFSNNKKSSIFYIEFLNYGMPIVKASANDNEDLLETKHSVKDSILEGLGINIYNPIKIISKEIALLSLPNSKNNINDYISDVSFNPFKLQDNSIFKNTEKNNSTENKTEDTGNLPNTVVNVYDPKLKKPLNNSKPEVFIYHTHTSESYKPGETDSYDETKNICAVGSELAKELENNYGISVVHDKTIHSTSYNQSYTRSRETIDKYLKKYGEFKLIIDIHRDSGVSKRGVTTKLNNEEVAKIMFVMAKNNPNFPKNNAIATQMVNISDKLFPGLSRGIYYYPKGVKAFNQDKSNNAILIEVGSELNTTNEAKGSTKYIARIVAEYLSGKK